MKTISFKSESTFSNLQWVTEETNERAALVPSLLFSSHEGGVSQPSFVENPSSSKSVLPINPCWMNVSSADKACIVTLPLMASASTTSRNGWMNTVDDKEASSGHISVRLWQHTLPYTAYVTRKYKHTSAHAHPHTHRMKEGEILTNRRTPPHSPTTITSTNRIRPIKSLWDFVRVSESVDSFR